MNSDQISTGNRRKDFSKFLALIRELDRVWSKIENNFDEIDMSLSDKFNHASHHIYCRQNACSSNTLFEAIIHCPICLANSHINELYYVLQRVQLDLYRAKWLTNQLIEHCIQL